MASIKQVAERKYKITISNGYRTDGRKVCKAKTIQVPETVPKRGIEQYVYHEAERLERLFKQGYSEDGEMTFETYARGWLDRQTKYAPGTLAFYRRSLETVFPEIGAIKLNKLRPIALENLLAKLRKRTYRDKPIKEKTVQKYLTVVSAVLSDAKRNEIIEKNPARMIDLPDAERKTQEIPTMEEMQKFLSALCYEEPVFQLFYFLAINTGMRRGECCALKWEDINYAERSIHVCRNAVKTTGDEIIVKAPKTKAGNRYVYFSAEMESLLREYEAFCAAETERYDRREQTKDDYVFRRKGMKLPMTPSTFTWRFKKILKANDLPTDLNVHSLRHTAASLFIASGTDVGTVAGLLGHSQPSTTLDIYTHAFDKNKKAASQIMQSSLEI